jgi:glycosyltransferase involved in cell wall biosynthesis
MRILLLAPAIEDYCAEYANALANSAQVTLLAPARTFGGHARFVDPAVALSLLDWPRHRSPANLLLVLRIIRSIRRLRPDVVHFLSEGVLWLDLVLPAVRKYGVVTTMHDVSYHLGDHASRRIPRWFADRLVERSDKIIVHGDHLREEAEQRYPSLEGKIAVLPHLQLRRYTDIARSEQLCRRPDPKLRILFFGRIYAYKGLDVLIRSVPLVTERFDGIRVIIAGEGEDIERYRKMMSDPEFFEVRNRRIPDAETAQLFLDADIVVLPYLEASQSGVLAIASAFAKPVIVTDVGELGRSVEDGMSGIVVPAGNERALADAILKLAADEALRIRFGQSGQAAAEATAAPEIIAARAIGIYRSIGKRQALGDRAGC